MTIYLAAKSAVFAQAAEKLASLQCDCYSHRAMHPPVSVIVTCFNLERYIAEAITSVREQDYGAPVELIVVDDASTDRSVEITEEFDSIRLVRNRENSGVLLSTLAGIEAASHDLLFFLDGDDTWRTNKLSQTVERFADPAVALVTHDLDYMGADSRPTRRRSLVERTMSTVDPQQFSEQVKAGIIGFGDYVWLGSAYAVHRQRGRVDEFVAWAKRLPDPGRTYQDWPLAYWVASLPSVEAAYVPAKLFSYRVHGSNYSGDASTPDRLRRNLIKSLNTSEAMLLLANERRIPNEYRSRVEQRCRFYRYQLDLLDGRRGRALVAFLKQSLEFRRRGIWLKEAARLLGVQLLGFRRFLDLSARRTIFRGLPPS